MKNDQKVLVTKNGPYLVSGNLPLAEEIAVDGKSKGPEKWVKGKKYPESKAYSLCRCGESKAKPFCDRSHLQNNFNGTEVASKEEYVKKAEKISGPELELTDLKEICSLANFCHLAGGTWKNVRNSNNSKAKKNAIQSACNCPSGRLVIWDKKTKKPIEPKFEPSIGITRDPQTKAIGPIRLKGGIKLISSDNASYESRNRMTLCRCGKSKNKPFCDGSHLNHV